MGKRKGVKEIPKTLISGEEIVDDERSIIYPEDREEEDEQENREGSRFFACYLLTSLCPRFKGHTYIGFTVNPRRRIRQHNGEIRSGAWRTKTKRPWELVLCIYGFPTNVAALQFEWAWQHPVESLAVRKAAANFKSLSGIANKIKLVYTMLTLPAWQSLNLTVNFFSTKYKMHTAGCPNLPRQMRSQVCSMDELPYYMASNQNAWENDDWDGSEEFSFVGDNQDSSLGVATLHEPPSYHRVVQENSRKQINDTAETSYDHGQFLENAQTRYKRNSPKTKEKRREPFSLNDSPIGSSSSSAVNISSYTVRGEDGHTSRSVEDFSTLLDDPLEMQSTTVSVAGRHKPLMTKSPRVHCEVEVIDVSTPSPFYRASAGRNKKRRSNVCPKIIDLTDSPIFL